MTKIYISENKNTIIKCKETLIAENGKEMHSEIVFIEAFKHIKRHVFKDLNKDMKKYNSEVTIENIKDIQWIITVPAIWNDIAKDKMITWIGNAGLTDENIKDHCLLKYEPDCASLSLQNELLKNKRIQNNITSTSSIQLIDDDNLFDDCKEDIIDLNGCKYILIDAGGGTIDIACHQFMNNNDVKELFYPTGGPWGDKYVDSNFIRMFTQMLGCVYVRTREIDVKKCCNYIQKYIDNYVTFDDAIKIIFSDNIWNYSVHTLNKKYLKIIKDGHQRKVPHKHIVFSLYGATILQSITNYNPTSYFDLIKNFGLTKIKFDNEHNSQTLNVILPHEFIDQIDVIIGINEFSEFLKKYELYQFKNCFSFDINTNELKINKIIWKEILYDPLIIQIIQKVEWVLILTIMKGCKYIYLVGGYTLTPYYQQTIKQYFGLKSKYKINIIIPSKPMLSIVDGAARMGLLKNQNRKYIKQRVLAKTYGETMRALCNDININDYSSEYIQKHANTLKNGSKTLKGYFKVYARKGTCIDAQTKFIFESERMNSNKRTSSGWIYVSDMDNPKTYLDGKKLFKYTIKFPKNDKSTTMITEVTFNETMKLISYPKNFPNKSCTTTVQYDWI